ncbi:MAG: UDP-glucose 4-epimerase GalE [Bacteroidetes bacterium]|nr:UDP-glucose 4-epimerase GalE [Bacteroidota bacterium]
MKILVTGGTGYIGSHTVVELQQEGFEVVIIDNLSNSKFEVVQAIKKITGISPDVEIFDLTDEKKVADFFRRHSDLTGIIHFAAFKKVGESVKEPLKYYRNNIVALLNLLYAMKKHSLAFFVFSSSCTVYGQPDQLPVSEDTPLKSASSPYGNTKKMSEEIIEDTVMSSGIKAISLRYFNPIGAHESALIGEMPLGVPDNLIPYVTQTAIGKRDHLRVFGGDYPTPDGTPIRDYIHITDLAKAHIVALQRLIRGRNKRDYEIFNLGTGRGYSVLEVIKSFEKVSGMKLPFEIVDRRQGDMEQVWADTSLANRELGWKALKDLDEMILSAWEWEKALGKNS